MHMYTVVDTVLVVHTLFEYCTCATVPSTVVAGATGVKYYCMIVRQYSTAVPVYMYWAYTCTVQYGL
eukprot:COSAG01_NODE_6846_length_3471_cov_17.654804_2_plen_67_part_00